MKCGIGQDSHRFEPEGSQKALVMGGVAIPGELGLAGNSDADVVLHALTNAVSGVGGVTILGPVSDRMCLDEGITDSREYLKKALETLGDYSLTHVSISVECARPKLLPHVQSIRSSLARLLGLDLSCIGFTATSGEGLTAFGKGEGVQAIAIVTAASDG
ncbi:MAG: 2-C-methyl-D-erythritol 2,4-cyclodiphosphate synthase [Chitinivibrionales bacterium]|nr:2-C-methyl-D-erythritol 2,4-cyclodiphosphate synthase [Chitinivibrionales bacterium]MBD3358955.1 2-C-methyl-D-erythritol 2,4-cyclodiphosphate synthase [Chitinivibrionales bacterium]